MTALMWAAMSGHDEVVKALLDAGANTRIKNKVRLWHITPLAMQILWPYKDSVYRHVSYQHKMCDGWYMADAVLQHLYFHILVSCSCIYRLSNCNS